MPRLCPIPRLCPLPRLCLTLLFAAVMFVPPLSAASTPADRIFPEATKGFLSIRDLKEFGEQWKQTQFGQLLEDPLMADFKNEIQKRLTERMETTFGLTLDGISSLPSGEVAFGMVAVPNQVPGFVLTMDVTGRRAETDRYLADLTQKLVGAGAKSTTETHREQQITILTFPPPDVQTPRLLGGTRIEITVEPIEQTAYYMFFQDVLIASNQMHLLKLIADRIAAPAGRSLADVEAYQVVMKRCIDDIPNRIPPIIRWYSEPLDYGESVRTLLRGPAVQGRGQKPTIFSILKQQGLDSLQGIGGVITVKTEAQESVSRTFIYTKKPYRLAMRMLNFPDNTNFTPPVWMPSDLARSTTFYVDPMAIFDNIGPFADAYIDEVGVWADILDGLKTDPFGPRIDVREELMLNLGNRVMGITRHEKPITPESESRVVAVELRPGREPAMRAGLEKLLDSDPDMQAIMHRTHKIWHRKPANVAGQALAGTVLLPTAQRSLLEEDAEGFPTIFPDGGVTVAGGYLLAASDVDYLKVILNRLDAPAEAASSTISTAAEYQEVERIFAGMGLTNRPHFFRVFAKTHETLRPTYELLRKGQMAESQSAVGKLLNMVFLPDDMTGTRQQLLDGSTMPEFDKIQHYFGKAGIYGITEANGYFIKGFTVEREGR